MASDAAKLHIDRASHTYDGRSWQFLDLDFDLRVGEITAILGPNGRGKSTLLRLLAGLIRPNSGSVILNARTGFVSQDFTGSFPYSVLDVVLMGRARQIGLFKSPGKADIEKSMAALEATGMADHASRDIEALSGGQRQLVLIARAIAGENEVLLLDEPASALDLKNQDIVLTLLSDLADRKKLAIAFTTHQPNHATAIADKVMLMMPDAQTVFGSTVSVMTENNLEQLYGLPLRLSPLETSGQDGSHCAHKAFLPVFRQRSKKDRPT